MKTFDVLQINDSSKWNIIVRSFEHYDVFYLNEYVSAFQLHGDGEPLLFYYEDGTLKAMHVVMQRDVSADKRFSGKLEAGKYFDFATPYGYAGWVVEGSGDTAPMYDAYQKWCLENRIVAEFIRFNLFNQSRYQYYGEVVPRTNNIVRKLDRPMPEMLADFEHKVRKNLKKAESNGLTITIDEDGGDLEDFLRIYYSTMDRNDAESEYYFKEAFFRCINEMKGHFAYFNVCADGKVISTELVICGSDTMYSYLGGTDSEYFDLRPNDFLKVKIIEWGLEKGYKQFVLGGGYGSDDGIFRYKKSFAPDGVVQFYTGQKILDQAAYDKLVSLRNDIDKESKFFPLYRA